MKLPNRKSKLERLLETVTDSLERPSPSKFSRPSPSKYSLPSPIGSLPGLGSRNALKVAMPKGEALKAGLVAGGLVGLTAGSAGISRLRRSNRGARDDS